MPVFFCSIGCRSENGGTANRSSIASGRYGEHWWAVPIGAFQFPMDAMTRRSGYIDCSHEEMIDWCRAAGGPYWHARCYRNYSGNLDFYVVFSESSAIHHFELVMPPYVQEAETLANVENEGADGAYPSPAQWWMATSKIYRRSYTSEEYDAMNQGV